MSKEEFFILVFFLISVGSMAIHNSQAQKNFDYQSTINKLISIIVIIISVILLIITNSNIFNVKWYWGLAITIPMLFVAGPLLTNMYVFMFGIKSKWYPSLMAGKHVRDDLHFFNSIITFILGLIVYLIS